MAHFEIRGGQPLEGTVAISGATKNSGCKILAAAMLAPGTFRVENIPEVGDLRVMLDLLAHLGVRATREGPTTLVVDTSGEITPIAPYHLVSQMRASVNVLGPLLARTGHASVALPGGDSIGARKLDMHVRGLERMGAEVRIDHGNIEARSDQLQGERIVLEFPSVGATENLMTAAVRAKGTTTIENAAREPEITELGAFLNRMGAHVMGAGTSTIEIHGVEELTPVDVELMGDRVEAGTILMACGIAGGEIELTGVRHEHLEIITIKLAEMGMRISPTSEGIWAFRRDRLRSVDVATLPFPGFATDFMPLAVAVLATADGTGIVTENVFDGRYTFTSELARMGADVRTDGRHAILRGVERLSGAPVTANDVRAGAALTIAGLGADGTTTVYGVEHVERGYPDLPAQLRNVGGDVVRVGDTA
ncbi:MAG: UDP-N-acetylglucosamine 1-carboxyvinyltransferase [Acidimicrobiia bacterium]